MICNSAGGRSRTANDWAFTPSGGGDMEIQKAMLFYHLVTSYHKSPFSNELQVHNHIVTLHTPLRESFKAAVGHHSKFLTLFGGPDIRFRPHRINPHEKSTFVLNFIPITSFQSENSHFFSTVKLGLRRWLYMDIMHRVDRGP